MFIARTKKSTCPNEMLQHYVELRNIGPDSSNFIFRPVVRTGHGRDSGSWSERTAVQAEFKMHSFWRGGATEAAKRCISDRLFKKHGRWKSDNAKDGYVS